MFYVPYSMLQCSYMKFGEGIGKITRKIDRKINVPEGIDPNLYHSVQKIAGDTYEPRLIGKGGEHLVFKFEDPKHPDTVYKVNYLATAALFNARASGPKDEAQARESLDREILRRSHRTRELKDYFGHRAVPVQRYMVRDLPVNADTIKNLIPSLNINQNDLPEKIPAWVTVQRKIDIPPEKKLSLNGIYPEFSLDTSHEGDRRLYNSVNQILLNQTLSSETPDDPELQKDYICHGYQNLKTIREKAEQDPEFLVALKKVAKQLVQYMQETGNALDLAGKDNLIMIDDETGWNLKMLDPLLNSDVNLTDLIITIRHLRKDKKIPRIEKITALNALNTMRITNALALIADIPDRVRLVDPLSENLNLNNFIELDDDEIPANIEEPKSQDMEVPIFALLNELSKLKQNELPETKSIN
jgi:hypothetical protein